MAKVEAVFTLTDRITNRLQKIEKTSIAAEKALGSLDKKIDRINRKIDALSLRLNGLAAKRINITADMNIKPALEKAAVLRIIKRDLEKNLSIGRVGTSAFGGSSSGSGSAASAIRHSLSSAGRVSANGLPLQSGSPGARAASRAGLANRGLAEAFMNNLGNPIVPATERQKRLGGAVFNKSGPSLRTVALIDGLSNIDLPFGGDGGGGGDSSSGNGGGAGRRRRWRNLDWNTVLDRHNDEQAKHRQKFGKLLSKQLRGGRGGYFRGASLGAILAGSGIAGGLVGSAGGAGAGAFGLLTGALALGGLGGTLAAGAIPLATGAIKGHKAVTTAQEAVKNAKTAEEYAAATTELARAQAALTPIQRRLIADTKTLKNLYTSTFNPIQGNIANIYSNFTQTAKTLQPTVAPAVAGFGKVGENLSKSAQGFFNDPREQKLLGRFLNGLVPLSGLVATALGQVAIIIERLVIAATPLATWMFKNINDALGGIIAKTKNGDLTKWTEKFDRFRPVLSELAYLFGDLAKTLDGLFDDVMPFTILFIRAIRGPLLDTLETLIRVGAEVAGPAVLGLLVEILRFIRDSAPAVAQVIKYIALALTQVLKVINYLNEATGGIGGSAVVLGIFSIFGLYKVATVIGTIGKAFGRTSKGMKVVRAIGRGMFRPLIASTKLAMTALRALLTRLAAVAAAESAIGGGPGGGKKGWIKALVRGAKPLALAAGILAAPVVGAEVVARAKGRNGIEGLFDDPTKGLGASRFLGGYGRTGGGVPGLTARGSQQTQATVNITGPININNGTDEDTFIERMRRAVMNASTNMPQQDYTGGAARMGG